MAMRKSVAQVAKAIEKQARKRSQGSSSEMRKSKESELGVRESKTRDALKG